MAEQKKNPKETATFLSKLFIFWTFPLFKKGARGTLGISDIYGPLKIDESERVAKRLETEWNKELEKLKGGEYNIKKNGKKFLAKVKAKPSLLRALLRTFFWDNVQILLVLLLEGVFLRSAGPVFQGQVINYFNSSNTSRKNDVIYYAAGLIVSTFGMSFCLHHFFLYSEQTGNRMRIACSSLIYRKLLKVGKLSMDKSAAGIVVNLMSNDLSRFDSSLPFLHYIWCAPIQVAIIAYITWDIAGVAALVGCGSILIASIPVFPIIGQLGKALRGKIASVTDKRIQIMNELVTGIQVVKMYAWEVPFSKVVSETRATEIRHIKSSSFVHAYIKGTVLIVGRLALFISMVAYSLLGNVLNARITFVLASFFNNLMMSISVYFPQAIVFLGEIIVTIKRVEQFLLLEELNFDNVKIMQPIVSDPLILKVKNEIVNKPTQVKMERVCANWIAEQLPPTLHDISIDIEGGQLCAIVGLVGSGKTSILNVLLKELTLGAGKVILTQNPDLEINNIAGSSAYIVDNPEIQISYASQDAWLFTATVRDNILFGQTFDENRYKQVVEACNLQQDFQQFSYGDKTLVGERGVSLSGGQRARINLARAIYKKANLYLLDDPLSAVDTKVARHLFQKCINEFLTGETRILVTHQLQFLKEVDHVVLMERGTIVCQGKYDELVNKNSTFSNILEIMSGKEEEDDLEEHTSQAERLVPEKGELRKRLSKKCSVRNKTEIFQINDNKESEPEANLNREDMNKGVAKNEVYIKYFQAGGSWFSFCLLVLLFVTSQLINSGNDYWVMYWNNAEFIRQKAQYNNSLKAENKISNKTSSSTIFEFDNYGLLSTNSFIYIYTILILLVIVSSYTRAFYFVAVVCRASYNLHNEMFANVLRTSMQFFHTNPSGRILNRFSKDVGSMDELLPKTFIETLQILFMMGGALVVVMIVNQWMIIVTIGLLVAMYYVRLLFLKTINPLKRIEGITKSPVFSHVNSTLNGLSTIRSGGKFIETMMIKQFDACQDVHTGANYLILASSAAFCIVIDMLCDIFVSLVTFSFILSKNEETFGGNVGLAISQSLMMTGVVQYGMKRSTEVITHMTSIERILQYTQLPQEEPLTTSKSLPENWPLEGKIIFKNVSMRYNENGPLTLKDLNVTIEPRWKVGIVGRTGAGKSSLISALFRLTGKFLEGVIEIDGVDTAEIGLPDLRTKISIIPQEPILFTASLRYNLDPFGNYADFKLWDVLKEVELNDVSLDQQVYEGGVNFSVGQRQLICLARAILRNNKVLILDEATANIDTHTDTLIQKTIRNKFAECTVLTVAHRLNTVIDSNRIIVMNKGRMVEFGHPYELLNDKPDGYFSAMINQLGETIAKDLKNLAKIKYQKQHTDTTCL